MGNATTRIYLAYCSWEMLLHTFTWHAVHGKRYYTHLLGMLFMGNATNTHLLGILFMGNATIRIYLAYCSWEMQLHAFTWHAVHGKRYYTHLLGMLFIGNATTRIYLPCCLWETLLHAFTWHAVHGKRYDMAFIWHTVHGKRYYTHSLGMLFMENVTTRIYLACCSWKTLLHAFGTWHTVHGMGIATTCIYLACW